MAYTLTLTPAERRAISWIGNRYGHGDRLAELLTTECESPDEFDADTDVTFEVPEHVAWEIREIGEECEYRWDCLGSDLAAKLTGFCDRIV